MCHRLNPLLEQQELRWLRPDAGPPWISLDIRHAEWVHLCPSSEEGRHSKPVVQKNLYNSVHMDHEAVPGIWHVWYSSPESD